MRSIIISIIIGLSLSGTLLAETLQQDTIFNQVDHLNRKQGFWKKKYKNGNIAYRGFFKDDKPRGDFNRYHENGILRAKMIYSSCGDSAQAVLYYYNVRNVAEGSYYMSQKDGEWNYYAQSGRLVLTETYKNGKKDGKFLTYYDKGNVYEHVTWKEDVKHGAIIQYFPDGNYKMSIRYENGKENGPMRVYYLSGQTRIDGNYKNGLKDGSWTTYDPQGNVLKQLEYIKGFATNHDELLEKESRELEELFKNAGKINEPSVEEFFQHQPY